LILDLLNGHLPAKVGQAELDSLLRAWVEEGDVEEQRETDEYMIHALDEDRLSDRKLFPPELRGVTW
jgi:hypothetical protein